MITILLLAIALFLSFYLLAKVCDKYFVISLDHIAKRWNMSDDAAGATLMAVGSSAPELFVAIISIAWPGGNHEDIGMGTIVGSALFNVLVIIGVVAVVRKAIIRWQPVVRDVLFYAISIIILILTFRDGIIDITEAASFVVLYVAYLVAVVKWKKVFPYEDNEKDEVEEEDNDEPKSILGKLLSPLDYLLSKLFPPEKYYFAVFGISIFIIAGLSWVLVKCAIDLSVIFDIPESIVALTVLAIGTSVPDMMSSIIVAKQGRGGMAISNAVGSNIFDILIGLGLPWLVMMLFVGGHVSVSTENLYSSIILLFATVIIIFFLLFLSKWQFGREVGYFLIFLYLLYLTSAILDLYLEENLFVQFFHYLSS